MVLGIILICRLTESVDVEAFFTLLVYSEALVLNNHVASEVFGVAGAIDH